MSDSKKLSAILDEAFTGENSHENFGNLVDHLDQHGMAIVLLLFSAPAALPIPAPGYSTILAIPLMIIGLRLLCGYETIWLPEKIRLKKFDPKQFSKIIKPMRSIALRLESFSKPRYGFLTSGNAVRFVGVIVCILALSMALPIPGTNTLPAGGIFLIGFSLLEQDGLILILGILYSIVAAALSLAIIFFGYAVVKAAISGLLG